LNIDLFDFKLPKDLIAQETVSPADNSKLLFIDNNNLFDKFTNDLPKIFKPGDIFVVNNTKVIKSRIFGRLGIKEFEFTFLDENKSMIWRSLVKGSKKLNIGDVIDFPSNFKFEIVNKNELGEVFIKVCLNKIDFIKYLNEKGFLPLPPYIKKTNSKNIKYQTLFAKKYGAVAAPTAGLHFTNNLKRKILDKKIKIAEITLHVGSGTFLPIKKDNINKHHMHEEYFEINENTAKIINNTKSAGGRVIAVGTTVLRALESSVSNGKYVKAFRGYTDIFIKPGYQIKSIDFLLTNFHLPKSTLFILVCALVGIETMQKAYRYAINKKYRFYSLGDACLIKKM